MKHLNKISLYLSLTKNPFIPLSQRYLYYKARISKDAPKISRRGAQYFKIYKYIFNNITQCIFSNFCRCQKYVLVKTAKITKHIFLYRKFSFFFLVIWLGRKKQQQRVFLRTNGNWTGDNFNLHNNACLRNNKKKCYMNRICNLIIEV